MKKLPLTPQDYELVNQAKEFIQKRYGYKKHHVGALLKDKDGKIYKTLHLDGSSGKIDVCAEAVALGQAIAENNTNLETIVAVGHPDPNSPDQTCKVVSPCGVCRELLIDFVPDIHVIIPDQSGELIKVVARDLLPLKYKKV